MNNKEKKQKIDTLKRGLKKGSKVVGKVGLKALKISGKFAGKVGLKALK